MYVCTGLTFYFASCLVFYFDIFFSWYLHVFYYLLCICQRWQNKDVLSICLFCSTIYPNQNREYATFWNMYAYLYDVYLFSPWQSFGNMKHTVDKGSPNWCLSLFIFSVYASLSLCVDFLLFALQQPCLSAYSLVRGCTTVSLSV